jgi:hypothetical protein
MGGGFLSAAARQPAEPPAERSRDRGRDLTITKPSYLRIAMA